MKLADYACRAVVRLYPRDIREAHGDEMRATFLEVCATRGSVPELGHLAVGAIKARAGYPRIPAGQEPMQTNNGGSWRSSLSSDFRQARRALMARPGASVVAVTLLAVAIAACTAVFTIADSVIFNQVPYRDADRIVCAGVRHPGRTSPSAYSPAPVVRAWRDAGIFEQVEAHESFGATLDEGAEPSTQPAARVTTGLFELLSVAPLRGRLFRAGDAREAVPPVMISERLWRSNFGADESIVGRSISIDGRRSQIVGVMPGDFRFPHGRQTVWQIFDLDTPPKEARNVTPVVKLRGGIPRDETARRAAEIVSGVNPGLMKGGASVGFNLPSGGRAFDDYTLNTVRVLFTGVLLVLLVACVNVANLLLAQALGRRRERAVRVALGASRLRLVRQALVESTAIASMAAALGLALAWAMISGFETLLPEFISTRTINAIDFDRRAAALVVALTAVATIAAGALPAWLGTRTGGGALKDGDRAASEGRAGRRIATALIVGEIAVSVALLAGAALMVRSFVSLASAERGIDTRGIVKLQLLLPEYQEADPQKRAALSTAVYDRIASLRGVEEITRTYGVPPMGGMIQFWPVQNDEGKTFERLELMGFRVTPGFFPMFRMELRAGRFLRRDDPDAAVVVGESLAERLWPGVPNPIGRTFTIGPSTTKQIVGITREVRTPLLDPRSDIPEYFELYKGMGTSFVIRFREGAAISEEALRSVVRAIHPKYVVQTLEPVDEAYDEMIDRPRAAVMAATAFAAFGMLVCAAGLFSVLSLSVARRRREFGIRLAIGAHPSQVSRLVMRETAGLLVAGIVLGIAGAFALARNLSAVLVGVNPSDAGSWVAVVAMVAMAGAAAAWLPVRDARRTDPLLLLREE